MNRDIVKELSFLCLGTRLKRAGDRLQMDLQRLLDAYEIPLATGQCPLLAAIDRAGPMTVGMLVSALGISQPGVTRAIKKLEHKGLIKFDLTDQDRRKRTVVLTPGGSEVVEQLKDEIWPAIEAAVAKLCSPNQGPLLEQISNLEAGLKRMPLDTRVKTELER